MLKDQRIGSRYLRKEDERLPPWPGELRFGNGSSGSTGGRVLRSPLAHARILAFEARGSKGAQACLHQR